MRAMSCLLVCWLMVAGCQSPPATPPVETVVSTAQTLEVGRSRVDVTVMQRGRALPVPEAGRAYVLAPDAVTLAVAGDLDLVTLLAVSSDVSMTPLQNAPALVTTAGTTLAWVDRNLPLQRTALETHPLSEQWLIDRWGTRPSRARYLMAHLQNRVDRQPHLLLSSRALVGQRAMQRLTIDAFDGQPPVAGQQIKLLLFLEDPIGESYHEAGFLVLPLTFQTSTPSNAQP